MNRWTSQPEGELARHLGVTTEAIEHARTLVHRMQRLPFPRPMREVMLTYLLDGPGLSVGASLVARILDRPPVQHLAELLDVDGIGEARLENAVRALQLHDPDDYVLSDPASVRATSLESAPTADAVPLEQLAGSASEQLGATSRRLDAAAHPMRLGDVQVTLRGALSPTKAHALAMRFQDDLAAGSASEVVLDFRPSEAPSGAEAAITVPDVRGYTRSLAERKVALAGLVARPVLVTVDDTAQAGRIQRQRPAPGSSARLGDRVHLFLGRPTAPLTEAHR